VVKNAGGLPQPVSHSRLKDSRRRGVLFSFSGCGEGKIREGNHRVKTIPKDFSARRSIVASLAEFPDKRRSFQMPDHTLPADAASVDTPIAIASAIAHSHHFAAMLARVFLGRSLITNWHRSLWLRSRLPYWPLA
jgi:hypothetical protein